MLILACIGNQNTQASMHTRNDGSPLSQRESEQLVLRDHALNVSRGFKEACKAEMEEGSTVTDIQEANLPDRGIEEERKTELAEGLTVSEVQKANLPDRGIEEECKTEMAEGLTLQKFRKPTCWTV